MAAKKKPDTLADMTPSPVAPESLRRPTPTPAVALEAWEPNPSTEAWEPNRLRKPWPAPGTPPPPYPINVVPPPVPFVESGDRKPAFASERASRLETLIAEGNTAAVLLSELGTWHETQASNAEGSWKVREFIWPNTPGALAAIRELGLHE